MKNFFLGFLMIFSVLAHGQVWTSNAIKWGDGSASNKTATVNVGGSNPQMRWNNSTSQWEMSPNSSIYKDVRYFDSSVNIDNAGFSAALSSNTLVVTLTQGDGSTAPTLISPAKFDFRSSSLANGSYSQSNFTITNSITLGTTDSIGSIATAAQAIYVYMIQDTTSEICLSHSIFNEGVVQSATALTGAADTTATVIYCNSAHTSRPIRLLGSVTATWSSPNWSSIARVSVRPFDSLQVQSPQTNQVSLMSASITNNGTAAILQQDGSWLASATRTSAGVVSLVITTGVCKTAPICTCGVSDGTNRICTINGAPNATGIPTFTNAGSNGTAQDQNFNIICICTK